MLPASSPASPRNSTPSKPKTPPSPSSNLPAVHWASCTSPPPPTPAIRAASRCPAPKAPSSSSTTASSLPTCAILHRTLPQPSLRTRTKAPHPLWSVIFAAIKPSSKTSSRPSSRTALRPATAPKAAAASPLSKPFIVLQKPRRKPQTSEYKPNINTRNHNLRARLDQSHPPPVPGPPPGEFDRVKAKTRLDAMIKLKTEPLPKAKRYRDYRDMLEHQKDKDIDAVVVATPDHMHAPIA